VHAPSESPEHGLPFNKNDAPAVAALYNEDAVFETPSGTFIGRQAIEKEYAKNYFEEHHSTDLVTNDLSNETH
jgi:ketosteroid isomerase-like protein